VRQRVGAFGCQAHEQGWTLLEVAGLLRLRPGTLRAWQRTARQPGVPLVLRGRPLACSPVAVRNAVIAWLDDAGPGVSLATLRDGFPDLARAELDDLLGRYRRLWQRRHTHAPHVLHWQVPGVVWALDFAEAPAPIDGRYPYLLAARDLASGAQLLWLPVAALTADATVAALTSLVAWHGAPLVVKSDNGSAFIAESTRAWAAANRVEWLFSPPGVPQYNGACEAGIGALKWRTERQAQGRGQAGAWSCDDADAARQVVNTQGRAHARRGATPAWVWEHRPALTDAERGCFATTLERCREEARQEQGKEAKSVLTDLEQRGVDRVAIRRALVAHGYLLFTRRRIPLPIPSKKVAPIS
jgi:transposase InsO family protein